MDSHGTPLAGSLRLSSRPTRLTILLRTTKSPFPRPARNRSPSNFPFTPGHSIFIFLQPLLVMRFHDGTVFEWTLSIENDRIHQNGLQYLRDGSTC